MKVGRNGRKEESGDLRLSRCTCIHSIIRSSIVTCTKRTNRSMLSVVRPMSLHHALMHLHLRLPRRLHGCWEWAFAVTTSLHLSKPTIFRTDRQNTKSAPIAVLFSDRTGSKRTIAVLTMRNRHEKSPQK